MRCRLMLQVGMLVVWLAGCDRDPAAVVTTAPAGAGAAAVRPSVRLTSLTPLQPDRHTHFAVDVLGNIYWVQETDAGEDVLYTLGDGAVPQATQLTAATILSAFEISGARGNLQSIAAAPDGGLYFYFAGGKGRDVIACVGHFLPRTGEIRVLADVEQIRSLTHMGASMALARGKLLPAGRRMWLWIWHTDVSALLQFDARPVAQSKAQQLRRPFQAVRIDQGEIVPEGNHYALAGRPDGSLVMVDAWHGTLWSVSPEGHASIGWSLVGLPTGLSSPAIAPDGRVLIFAARTPEVIKERSAAQITEPVVQTTYPALLLFSEREVAAIDDSEIVVQGRFPAYAVHLTDLVPDRAENTWISYDRNSGNLLRVEIRGLADAE